MAATAPSLLRGHPASAPSKVVSDTIAKYLARGQRCHGGFWRFVDDSQEGAGGALGVAFALLPIAQRFDGDVEAFGEGGLAEAGSRADAADISGGVLPCLAFVLGDVAGYVLFAGGIDLGIVDARWCRGLGAVGIDDKDFVTDQLGVRRSGLAHGGSPFGRR